MTSQAPQRLGLVFPEQPAGNSSQQHSSDAYACLAAATGISGQKQATNRYQNTSSYPRSGDGGVYRRSHAPYHQSQGYDYGQGSDHWNARTAQDYWHGEHGNARQANQSQSVPLSHTPHSATRDASQPAYGEYYAHKHGNSNSCTNQGNQQYTQDPPPARNPSWESWPTKQDLPQQTAYDELWEQDPWAYHSEVESEGPNPPEQRHTLGISSNPWRTTLRSEMDSFTMCVREYLPQDLAPDSPEAELSALMYRYGMPRDPSTWQRWPDLFFPKANKLPNGWTRLWDELAHRIICYRVLDGLIHLNHCAPCSELPLIDKDTRTALECEARQKILAGDLAVVDVRVIPALREARRTMLLNLHAANSKAGLPMVATVEQMEAIGNRPPKMPKAMWPDRVTPGTPPLQLADQPDTPLPSGDAAPTEEHALPKIERTNLLLQQAIFPTAPIQLPWTVPPALRENGSILAELCSNAPVVDYPALHILAAMGAESAGHPLPGGIAGPGAWDQASPTARELDIGHLPWPNMVSAVFNTAAKKYLQPQEIASPFTRTMVELILERSGTAREQDFVSKLAQFGKDPTAQRILYMKDISTTALGRLNRPGAWLLDYVYTVMGVLFGVTRTTAKYTAVLNATHRAVMERCFPDVANTSHANSDNNRGNQMEALCWELFESGLAELILAQAFHSLRLARAAKCAETGSPPPQDISEPPSHNSQSLALIRFAHLHGYSTHSRGSAPGATPSIPPPLPPGAFGSM